MGRHVTASYSLAKLLPVLNLLTVCHQIEPKSFESGVLTQ